jgi:hypothetical protein
MKALLTTCGLFTVLVSAFTELTEFAAGTSEDFSEWTVLYRSCYNFFCHPRCVEYWADQRDKQYGFEILPILPEHAVNLIRLPFHHKNPFDRLLVAPVLTEGIPIVSVDAQLDSYGVTRIW